MEDPFRRWGASVIAIGATRGGAGVSLSGSGLQPLQGPLDLPEGSGNRPVVDPPAFLSLSDEARLLQLSEVEGDPGLGPSHLLLELADTALSLGQKPEKSQAGFFRHSLEPEEKEGAVPGGRPIHGGDYINEN